MTDLLIVLAVLAGVAGLASLSQATTGVGVICGGCLLAIFGRIAQATQQHKELKALLEKTSRTT